MDYKEFLNGAFNRGMSFRELIIFAILNVILWIYFDSKFVDISVFNVFNIFLLVSTFIIAFILAHLIDHFIDVVIMKK